MGQRLAVTFAIVTLTLVPISRRAAAEIPTLTRVPLEVCLSQRTHRDLAGERHAVAEATAVIAAAHRRTVHAIEQARAREDETTLARLAEVDRTYYRQRFDALFPLAAAGNSEATYQLAILYGWVGSDFADRDEFLRLQQCAADLGNPSAQVEMSRIYWHDTADGVFEVLTRNRAVALDLVESAARNGDLSGIASIGVYIGAGQHLYPIKQDLGRRILRLCALGGSDGCKAQLVQQDMPYSITSARETFVLLRDLALRQPELYGKRREESEARLSKADLAAVRGPPMQSTARWIDLEPQWRRLRAEIAAGESPCELECARALPCTCRVP